MADCVLETFDDKLRAQAYRDQVLREMQQRGLNPRYGVAVQKHRVRHQTQWWVVLRDRGRREG